MISFISGRWWILTFEFVQGQKFETFLCHNTTWRVKLVKKDKTKVDFWWIKHLGLLVGMSLSNFGECGTVHWTQHTHHSTYITQRPIKALGKCWIPLGYSGVVPRLLGRTRDLASLHSALRNEDRTSYLLASTKLHRGCWQKDFPLLQFSSAH